ncbi:MAG: luciferase domain-containing protein [Solirubrobacteraceae bacterium]
MSGERLSLPRRDGPPPEVIGPAPHAQRSQIAPSRLQDELAERALALPSVSEAESLVSVPGARAFVLAEDAAGGPAKAFQAGREFAHLHPAYDGSLHMTLPAELAHEAYEKGWGEPHPFEGTALIFGPRDEQELEVVWNLLVASYEYATGTYREPLLGDTRRRCISLSNGARHDRLSRFS